MHILLADDHTLFRDALVSYVERSDFDAVMDTVGDLGGAIDFINARKGDVDIVLLDMRMPGMNGLKGLKKLLTTYPDVRVVLMSGLAESEDVSEALDMGAAGFFPKTMSGKAMIKGIQQVLNGEIFVPHNENDDLPLPSYDYGSDGKLKDFSQENGGDKTLQQRLDQKKLTPREAEVLGYLVTGASNKEIARDLELQEVTVKLHVRSICRKLGAKNRTQAALFGQQIGM
ncbi:MAG: response regulator transcription factor [Rhodospirillales bacterium]|nr:response regulator transcription factor [Rhodospirillales bacterium]